MSLASEFKEFAMKGNVVDMAVGVIVGAAFGRIVTSLVGDIFMPMLGRVTGGFDFSELALSLGKDPTGKAVLIRYGVLVQDIIDFLIIAIVLFLLIKAINRLKHPPVAAAPPPPPPRQEQLLEQIRDLLAKQ
ncbi:MAG TPA: large-conductance mechanosensitive channel protein MscL [Steroidobacteraceae bacterium]|jgi:large conductance mechanosensitive channel|nr:large-conductance mechanosensitive channel protein MscL [Steroidobacteraceae bacterium]